MRFKLDENLPVELADLFRQAGHDAVTVLDQGHGGSPDRRLANICRQEDRTLVTFDTDFADIREYPPRTHPGIVVLRLDNQARGHTLAVGARFLRLLPGNSLDGQLWIVEDTRVRIRD